MPERHDLQRRRLSTLVTSTVRGPAGLTRQGPHASLSRMAGEASLDEKLASRDFVTDFVWAARTVFAQPSVALVSIAVWVMPVLLNRAALQSRYPVVVSVGLLLLSAIMLGWVGVERVFFRRRREGERVALSELLADVPFFIGRFLRLGLLVGMAVTPLICVLGYLVSRHDADATHAGATTGRIAVVTIMVPLDLALTFVTSALVFTTRSAWQALRIGLAMIRQTWPRSGLYLLCPPLALNMLNAIYPTDILVVTVVTTAGLGLLALLAKGAIVAFYLRERPVPAAAAADID